MTDRCPVCGAEYHGTPFCTACGARVIQPPSQPGEPPSSLPPDPAGAGFPGPAVMRPPPPEPGSLPQRVLALVLDALVVSFTALGMTLAATAAWWAGAGRLPDGYWEEGFFAWWVVLTGFLGVAYSTVFIGGDGQTPGKAAVGIAVEDARGRRRVGYGRAFVRALGALVSGALLGLGFLWVLWDPRRRGWHDQMADTLVVRKAN